MAHTRSTTNNWASTAVIDPNTMTKHAKRTPSIKWATASISRALSLARSWRCIAVTMEMVHGAISCATNTVKKYKYAVVHSQPQYVVHQNSRSSNGIGSDGIECASCSVDAPPPPSSIAAAAAEADAA